MQSAPGVKVTKGKGEKLVVEHGKRKASLTYQEVFALGHSLFQAGKYGLARDVFGGLAKIGGRGPRAKIMLARCKAEIESFDTCNEILQGIFDGEDSAVAEELQGAFVFHTMGMQDEAIRAMVKVIKEYPDFPTAFLYLGDLYLEKGNAAKAAYCWKIAVKRDRKGGAVAIAARKQLAKLRARGKKSKARRGNENRTRNRRK